MAGFEDWGFGARDWESAGFALCHGQALHPIPPKPQIWVALDFFGTIESIPETPYPNSDPQLSLKLKQSS